MDDTTSSPPEPRIVDAAPWSARASGATPAMARWFELKALHPDALLFYRMGDFYELFFEDAEAAAAALDIALTARGEQGGAPIPMCGVPAHAAEAYLARLIRRGFRVAIVEQLEDPKARRSAKTPIARDVVRLVTPGTLTEETLLAAGAANLLLALAETGGTLGAAWADISTGLFETAALRPDELPALLGRLDPAEIVASETVPLSEWTARRAPLPTALPPAVARRQVGEAFAAASIDSFGTFADAEAIAAAAVLTYARSTQIGTLPRLSRPSPQGEAGVLAMDAATRASLDILRARDGGTEHTLLSAVSRTVTAAGARLFAARLAAPLTDCGAIARRQDAWSWLLANRAAAERLRALLRGAPDISRALGRVSLGRFSPRDLAAVRDGLTAAAAAMAVLDAPLPPELAANRAALAGDPALAELLRAALSDPAPARLDDGDVIRSGFDGELDACRRLRDDSRQVIAGLQLEYAQRYGVASLKIRHHAQLGYVIEAPSAAVERLRAFPDLSLRQGMANGARFTSAELSELDQRIREAAEAAAVRERIIIAELCRSVLDRAELIAACADALAALDVAQSAARLAEGGTWCRPAVVETADFRIDAGRHPVVEAAMSGGSGGFVPNECDLSPDRSVMLLTGPNMAGKSTFLRQNALIVVLAQAGLPVPAEAARIGLVDRLFSRVGGADDLARGRSTFMVEMTETAAILNQAGPRSLVVVDEIGRGTSTLDGLAIAWAVLEALHGTIRCRAIFATHFHELADLAPQLRRLRPHAMRVKEWKGSVVFLHEVVEGAAGRSFGVHVARLAGVPDPVVRRATSLLAGLERGAGRLGAAAALPLFAHAEVVSPLALHAGGETGDAVADPLRDALAAIDPDSLAPREALLKLYELKSLATPSRQPPMEHSM